MEDEKVVEELREYIDKEHKTGEYARGTVADALADILDDSGSVETMRTDLWSFIDAATGALKKIDELVRKMEPDPEAKNFRVEYDVRHCNGSFDIRAKNAQEAMDRLVEDVDYTILEDSCPDLIVGPECAYEIDAQGKEVPGTRVESE